MAGSFSHISSGWGIERGAGIAWWPMGLTQGQPKQSKQ